LQYNQNTKWIGFGALRSGAPIIPVGISGSEAFEHSGAIFKRSKVTVTIGQPFSFSKGEGKLTRDQLTQSADQIVERIAELLPKEYRGVYGESDSIKGNTGVVSGSKAGI
jgi:1-acyl-sn-glycerol-3-phosphate acyltransferase